MFIVYHRDGYAEDTDISEFETEEEAIIFIEERLEYKGADADIENYRLFEADEYKLVPKQVVTKVEAVNP